MPRWRLGLEALARYRFIALGGSLSGLLLLFAWRIGLARFSISSRPDGPDWVIPAVANGMLAIALFTAVRGHERVSQGLLWLPVLVATGGLIEHAHPAQPSDAIRLGSESPYVTSLTSSILPPYSIFSILAAAVFIFLIPRKGRRASQVIVALTSRA